MGQSVVISEPAHFSVVRHRDFQQRKELYHRLNQFVARCRNAQGSRFTVCLGNMDSTHWGKAVATVHDLADDPFGSLDRKAIESFAGNTGRESAFIRSDLRISLLPKERVSHHSQ